MSNSHEEWKATWDWATEIWGGREDHSFNRFFRTVAQKIAEAEEWEELGSSDVWCATYDDVKRLKDSGEVTTREELVKRVIDASGYFYGMEARMLGLMYSEPGAAEGFAKLFAPA